ncbi:MAG: MarR family transcriptional regulator [Burkholderiales bacterium]|nr:MarR family transcriptional regulator [Burkholderiales bacterium]
MPTPKNPSVDSFLCFALYSTSLSMTQRYKPLLQEIGVTYPQYLVLLVLWNQQGLGIKEIAARLHQDPGSITPLVKRLESLGYVARNRDAKDERNLIVTLTPAGEALRNKSCEIRDSIASACRAPDEEIGKLIDTLLALRANLSVG